MRLDPSGGTQLAFGTKKVRTLNVLPKVLSLDARVLDDILPSKKGKKESGGLIKKQSQPGLMDGKVGDDAIEEQSEDPSKQDGSDSDSGDSSIDMDGDDEDKMYQNVLKEQNKADQMKDAKDKGQHLDDLVDKEMIDLLNVCNRLHMPKIETLEGKFVNFGEIQGSKKVLILDMDETMLQAKFL